MCPREEDTCEERKSTMLERGVWKSRNPDPEPDPEPEPEPELEPEPDFKLRPG